MIQNNEGLNTSRMVANNGQDFADGAGTITGVFFGFSCGAACKISAITVENANGDSIDGTHADWANLISTTQNLNGFISAGLVNGQKGYITSVTFTGATSSAVLHRDTMSPNPL